MLQGSLEGCHTRRLNLLGSGLYIRNDILPICHVNLFLLRLGFPFVMGVLTWAASIPGADAVAATASGVTASGVRANFLAVPGKTTSV